ncbi:MAG: endonuclease/exonuclease/phosphatase family protein [Gammaproteobacteria bacterium]|nr:endonuclease/exonuclease/phosphatase family protein [Gammaproteobacteria bacterium]MDH3448600.1 endonuclease/exonuclease/phosphatase family protein [Gammaproteobacteria bacterium]
MINILTYNIHKGFDRYNRDFVLHKIKEHLQNAEVDIVLLQEIQGRHFHHESRISAWPDVSQFEFLADSIWPHYAYAKNAIYRKGHHGNAILSKFEISDWTNLNLSRFQRASRSMLHGKVELPEGRGPVHLLCVHLDLIGFERKRQIRELKLYIESTIDDSEPVILGGDFNDWHGGLGKSLESQLGMQEAYRELNGHYAKTFPSHWPMLRMDRIYFRGINLVNSFRMERHPWDELSDHLPLYARFTLG